MMVSLSKKNCTFKEDKNILGITIEIYTNYEIDNDTEEKYVTIYTPTFNQAKFFETFFHGIQIQKSKNIIHLLILDDNSEKSCFEAMIEFINRCSVTTTVLRFVKNQHTNKHLKFGVGAQFIKGKYIAFCEMDDYWTSKTKIHDQLRILDGGSYSWSFARALVSDATGLKADTIPPKSMKPIEEIGKEALSLTWGQIPTCTMIFSRSVFEKTVEKFLLLETNFTIELFFILNANNQGNCAFLDETVGVYRLGLSNSFTNNIIKNSENKMAFYRDICLNLTRFEINHEINYLPEIVFKLILWHSIQYLIFFRKSKLKMKLKSILSSQLGKIENNEIVIFGKGFVANILLDILSADHNVSVFDSQKSFGNRQHVGDSFGGGVAAPIILISPLGIGVSLHATIKRLTQSNEAATTIFVGDLLLDKLISDELDYAKILYETIDVTKLALVPAPCSYRNFLE